MLVTLNADRRNNLTTEQSYFCTKNISCINYRQSKLYKTPIVLTIASYLPLEK